MQGIYEGMKAFIIDGSHLVIAKSMKEVLSLLVEKSIFSEEGLKVVPADGHFEEVNFFRKLGDLNNLDEVKALLTFYKDETISLSYNGQYVLSQETVGGYIRSRDTQEAVLLCSKQTKFNEVIGEETWMKVDEQNPIWLDVEEEIQPIIHYNAPAQFHTLEEEVEETEQIEETTEEVVEPWPYALRHS